MIASTLISLSPLSATTNPPVLHGPTVDPATGRGYLVIHAHGLNSARAYAEALGGTLAAINTPAEQAFLESLDLPAYVRIGLVSTPSGWGWESGEPLWWNDWGLNSPTTSVNYIATGITNWLATTSASTGPFLIERPTPFPTEAPPLSATLLASRDVQLEWFTTLPATIELYRNGALLTLLPAGVQQYVDPAPELPAEYMVVLNSATEERLPARSYVPHLHEDFSFSISDATGVDSAVVTVEATNQAGGIQGYSAAISHDPTMTISAVEEGPSVLSIAPGGSWYFAVDSTENGVVVNAIFSLTAQVILEPGSHEILELTVDSRTPEAPVGGELFFCDWLDEFSTELIAVTDGDAHHPFASRGTVTYSMTFLRGDCSGDGTVDVSDPIFLIGRLFNTLPYPCVEACDANDDGGANIADVVYLLGSLFIGTEPPPAPYPDCGLDSDPESVLPCAVVPSCP